MERACAPTKGRAVADDFVVLIKCRDVHRSCSKHSPRLPKPKTAPSKSMSKVHAPHKNNTTASPSAHRVIKIARCLPDAAPLRSWGGDDFGAPSPPASARDQLRHRSRGAGEGLPPFLIVVPPLQKKLRSLQSLPGRLWWPGSAPAAGVRACLLGLSAGVWWCEFDCAGRAPTKKTLDGASLLSVPGFHPRGPRSCLGLRPMH